MDLRLIANILFLTFFLPVSAPAKDFKVWVGQVMIDDPQVTTGQKQLYRELMEALGIELKKSPVGVKVYSTEEVKSWFIDQAWTDLRDRKMTHFITAIPRVESDGAVSISWEVGALGLVGGVKVPVFAGRLTGVLDARILVLDGDQTQTVIANATPRNKAAAVAEHFRKLFPELGPAYIYYLSCIQLNSVSLKPPAPKPEQWVDRRERLLMRLLAQLTAQNELQHAGELSDLKEEARAACLDEPTAKSLAKASAEKADFLLSGTTRGRPNSKISIEVSVDNRPGVRRQRNTLTYQPGQVSDTGFLTQLAEWMTKYEGNRKWQLTVCGPYKDFWATPPKIETFADPIATLFQGKLAVMATDSPGDC